MRYLISLLGALLMTATAAAQQPEQSEGPQWSLVIHGGAGVIERDRLTPEQDRDIRAALSHALATGSAVLDGGGSATDAVEATIRELEDDPHFNAGRGAVFTYEGTIEHDAAIMNGETRGAGAITGSMHTRHPVTLARRVMENSPHVFLRGHGADEFSVEQGLEQVENEWFMTDERRRQLDELKAGEAAGLSAYDVDLKYGTVGAVALDEHGHVAAATSTGGLTGKRWGRIGDSPIIGAGTFADDRGCAVSATGAGEYFIRIGVAHEICARLRVRAGEQFGAGSEGALSDQAVQEIADAVMAEVQDLGGTGGVIVTTPWGNRVYSFNTPGMYRGMAASGSEARVAIYGDEE